MELDWKGLIFGCDRLILFIFKHNLDLKGKFREGKIFLHMSTFIYSLT